ncbi:twitching motility protein PilT [Achromatium sp. WMS3]|nr:twitching motility protein PilT [Achromatium sp. WMS3]
MYLLDTNVVSELRRIKPHVAVLAWIQGIDDKYLFISVVTIAEIQAGIEITREQNYQKAKQIENWLDQIVKTFNVLNMDAVTFRTWAKLMHRKSNQLYEDAMIAATAKQHDLIVVTRNVNDFVILGSKVLNPFDGKSY